MKNLSQFPRKISAKFCYGQLEFSDHFDATETQTESVPRKNERVEPLATNIDTQKNLNKLQQQIADQEKIRDEKIAEELVNKLKDPNAVAVEEALREVPGDTNDALKDFAADNIVSIISNFFARNKELREDYDNAPANTIANIENDEKFPGIIGSSQIEDYDIAA